MYNVLEDYNVQTMPCPKILREIVLKAATIEFVDKCFLPLLKIRQGMGSFCNSVSKEMVDVMYTLCIPTSSTVMEHLHCVPLEAQDAKVLKKLH